MAGPMRCSFSVPGTKYDIEVDGSRRIAQVWLSSCLFEKEPRDVSFGDQRRILSTVEDHRYELKEAFDYNRDHGAD